MSGTFRRSHFPEPTGGADAVARRLYRPNEVLQRAVEPIAPAACLAGRAKQVGAYAAFWRGATGREIREALVTAAEERGNAVADATDGD